MKNIKSLIIEGSLGVKLITGIVAIGVLSGIGFSGYKAFTYYRKLHPSMETKIESLNASIDSSISMASRISDNQEVIDLSSDLSVLKSSLDSKNYDEVYSKYEDLSSKLNDILASYNTEVSDLVKELESLDVSKLDEKSRNLLAESISHFKSIASVGTVDSYKNAYNECKDLYNELLSNSNPSDNLNAYITFVYDFENDGRMDGYFGSTDDFHKIYSALSEKSTVPGFNEELNRAVCALTQGAYEDKVKSYFVGKTYDSKFVISDVTFEKYTLGISDEEGLAKSPDSLYEELNGQGIENLPSGLFSTVVGSYTLANDNDNICFIKMTAHFTEL